MEKRLILSSIILLLLVLVLGACSQIEEKEPVNGSEVISGYHFEGYENYKAEIIEDDEGCKFIIVTNPNAVSVSERAIFDVEFLGGCEF